MRILVKVKDIEIEINDNDNSAVVRIEPCNRELQKTIQIICAEAVKILKELENKTP